MRFNLPLLINLRIEKDLEERCVELAILYRISQDFQGAFFHCVFTSSAPRKLKVGRWDLEAGSRKSEVGPRNPESGGIASA